MKILPQDLENIIIFNVSGLYYQDVLDEYIEKYNRCKFCKKISFFHNEEICRIIRMRQSRWGMTCMGRTAGYYM